MSCNMLVNGFGKMPQYKTHANKLGPEPIHFSTHPEPIPRSKTTNHSTTQWDTTQILPPASSPCAPQEALGGAGGGAEASARLSLASGPEAAVLSSCARALP